jgi:biotin operon repressor
VDGEFQRLLVGESESEADATRIAEVLAACPAIEIEPGAPYFHQTFPAGSLLAVEHGFVVARMISAGRLRSIITCDAGPGKLVVPPSAEEVLFGLGASHLTVIPPELLGPLLAVPAAARMLLDHLATTLAEKHEAIGNFGNPRHIDRVRAKLTQLGRRYGRVGRDGIRIDFPVSHLVLAEMVGSSRETVTRAVDELQRTGFVARRGHAYRLLVPPESVTDAAA